MKLEIYGRGGEFILGTLSKKQAEFLRDLLTKYSDNNEDNNRIHIEDDVWETDIINKPWNEYDDLSHLNGAYEDLFYIQSDDDPDNFKKQVGEDSIVRETKGLGIFEIDYGNDDRLEFSDDNTKIILGWNQTDAYYDKGFNTFKAEDFNEEFMRKFKKDNNSDIHYFDGAVLGTVCLEKGQFGEFELPDNFDKSKLILVFTHLQFDEENRSYPMKYLSKIFYDGKEVEVEFTGDTTSKDFHFFLLESNHFEGKVDFDYEEEFTTESW